MRRKNQRGRAYGPPRSSAPLLSSIYWSPRRVRSASQPADLARGAGCPEADLPKRQPLPAGPRTPDNRLPERRELDGVQPRLGATGNRADQPVGPVSVESSQKRRNGAADRLDRRQPKGAGPGAGPILHAQPVHHSKRLKR